MVATLVMIPLILIVVTIIYSIGRNLFHVWLEHRVRLLLLEKVQARPDLVTSLDELQSLLEAAPTPRAKAGRQDLLLTGTFLALIGLGFVLIYGTVGSGSIAVGAYVGGVICVVFGFILAVVGMVARFLMRPPRP